MSKVICDQIFLGGPYLGARVNQCEAEDGYISTEYEIYMKTAKK